MKIHNILLCIGTSIVMLHFSTFILSVIIALLFLLIGLIIVLKFGYSIQLRDMPKIFYNAITNPLEKIIYPTINTFFYGLSLMSLIIFFNIFTPLFIECMNFIKYGIWESLSINEILISISNNIQITYFDIPNYRGIEKILNWIFFESNASIALLIIFIVYRFICLEGIKLIDGKVSGAIIRH